VKLVKIYASWSKHPCSKKKKNNRIASSPISVYAAQHLNMQANIIYLFHFIFIQVVGASKRRRLRPHPTNLSWQTPNMPSQIHRYNYKINYVFVLTNSSLCHFNPHNLEFPNSILIVFIKFIFFP
jgi:hypothetical protein